MLAVYTSIIGVLFFSYVTGIFADSIGSYYVSNDEDCTRQTKKYECEEKCGLNHACLYGRCICLKPKSTEDEVSHSRDDRFSDFDDYTEMTPMLHPRSKEEDHPILRHHIAHFCPNLEVARKCIRGCMKLGKPAFCGKDHVCYCGHKYDKPETAQKVNPRDTYAQFRDMYKKYFGANEGSDETVEEELEKGKRVLMEKNDEEEK